MDKTKYDLKGKESIDTLCSGKTPKDITISGNCGAGTGLIKGRIPFPYMAVASRRRSIVKTLSYRAIVTVILAVVTFVFTGNLYQTSTIAIVFGILATLTYYLHERLWSMINWR